MLRGIGMNISRGEITAVAITALNYRTGETSTFVEGKDAVFLDQLDQDVLQMERINDLIRFTDEWWPTENGWHGSTIPSRSMRIMAWRVRQSDSDFRTHVQGSAFRTLAHEPSLLRLVRQRTVPRGDSCDLAMPSSSTWGQSRS